MQRFWKHNYTLPLFFTSSCSVIIENNVEIWYLNLPCLLIWYKPYPEALPLSNSPLIHMFLLSAKEWWSDNVNLIYLWWSSLWKLGGKAWNEKFLDISESFSSKRIVKPHSCCWWKVTYIAERFVTRTRNVAFHLLQWKRNLSTSTRYNEYILPKN